jgi:hypothetical protein
MDLPQVLQSLHILITDVTPSARAHAAHHNAVMAGAQLAPRDEDSPVIAAHIPC